MSFSFNFSGGDISDSEVEETTRNLAETTITPTSQLQSKNPAPILIAPKRHTLPSLLASLPSQLTYNHLSIPITSSLSQDSNTAVENGSQQSTKISLPRRSLFDMRQQLMAESDPSDNTDSTATLLEGLESGDLRTGIYEGGFKTWECAVDLAGCVSGLDLVKALDEDVGGDISIIELGAGSAIPSLVLLGAVLQRRRKRENDRVQHTYGQRDEDETAQRRGRRKLKFTFCDYNEDVLRLCTAANVFLTTMLASREEHTATAGEDVDVDVDVDEHITAECLRVLEAAGVEIEFISGAWGIEFTEIIRRDTYMEQEVGSARRRKVLVLASETIYSLDSLRAFSRTVLELLAMGMETDMDVRVLVAAKKVYFGVGGGVAEFEGEIRQLGGKTDVILDMKDAGVGRVVLEVKLAR